MTPQSLPAGIETGRNFDLNTKFSEGWRSGTRPAGAVMAVAHLLLDPADVMAKTILVVDDDPAVLESYGRVLLSEDSERVRTDPDRLSGIDLLILDQRMPRTSGLALLDSLRRRVAAVRGDQGAPVGVVPAVILISALPSDELRDEAARLGVAEVIEKPVDTRHLLASVRAALESTVCQRPADSRIPRP